MPNQYRDPIADLAVARMNNDDRTWKKFAENADVSTTTCYNLVKGKTRRPSHKTIVGIMTACGGKEMWDFGDGRPPVTIDYRRLLKG